jgi:hypothetical protein
MVEFRSYHIGGTKMKRIIKGCFIALALVLMVTPLVACGGDGTTTPPSGAGGNQAPVITSLSAEEATLTPNAETRITCEASDPDGDELTYDWEATGGTITAYNEFIFWKAPSFTGEFTISATVEDDKGNSAAKNCTITVVTNQRPVVSQLTPEPATLRPDETSTITCEASDPDGDELTYTWTASGGEISGTGKIVTWQAPSVVGEFVITVSLNDGKEGGITESSCQITVSLTERTTIFTPVASESGSVFFAGDIISAFKIGDNEENEGMQPYFSFDISELANAEIKEATLVFTVKETVGNPWFNPPFLYVEYLKYYEPRPLEAADFHLTGYEVERFSSEIPREVDVRLRLEQAVRAPVRPRIQFRLRFDTATNLNSQEDYIEFSQVELVVTYVK